MIPFRKGFNSRQLQSLLPFILIGILSCNSHRQLRTNYIKPIVSIDSLFKSEGIKNGYNHARRLTVSLARLMDSVALDDCFNFVPNYRLNEPVRSDYSVSAILGGARFKNKLVAVFKGSVIDHFSEERTDDFGCYGKDPYDLDCFCYYPVLQDSTDYMLLKTTLQLGFKLRGLVPFSKILTPQNSTSNNLKSISIDRVAGGRWRERNKSVTLTHLINNILVFSQYSYERRVFSNHKDYNYFNNYNLRRKDRVKADIRITCRFANLNDSTSRLNFRFFETSNTKPILIQEKFIDVNYSRMERGDFSEVMIGSYFIINAFLAGNVGAHKDF